MAQFIQANQLSPIQGTIGGQQVIQDNSPDPSALIGSLVDTIDTAGTIYGEAKGRAIATEEIENIERARAEAESGRFTAGDEVPESINMDQKEWDTIAAAVQSGSMTRDRARLLASSRLRSRIAEEPFFAGRMRKAASGLLGFNIESEAAQQYFSSFPTRGAQSGGGQTQQEKWMDQAEAISASNGIPAEKIYRQIAAAEYGAVAKDIAVQERDAGIITDQQAFTRFNQNNSEVAFTGIVGTIQEVFQEEGSVKPERMNRIMADAKAVEIQELTQLWSGDQTSAEFQRATKVIDDRYTSYKEFSDSVGYDTLQEIAVNRNKNERELFTDQLFSDVKIINEVAGQEGVKAYFDSMSPRYNETQRRQLFEQFPVLKRLHSLSNASPEEISNRLNTTSRKLLSGEALDEADREVLDPVAKGLLETTESDSVKTRIFDELAKQGQKYKAVSIVTERNPNNTSTDNVANVKRAYSEEMPKLITSLGREVATWSEDVNRFDVAAVEMVVDAGGNIQVSSQRPLSLPQGKLNELKNMASKINQFNKAHNNGWSTVLGESKDSFVLKAQQLIEEGNRIAATQGSAKQQERFTTASVSGEEDVARSAYERMQEDNPEAFNKDFDVLYKEIRRRRLEATENARRGG